MHQQQKGKLPDIFNKYYTVNSAIHDYHTRQSNKLNQRKPKSSVGCQSLKIVGAKLYNDIPDDIKTRDNLQSFRSAVKRHLLSSY